MSMVASDTVLAKIGFKSDSLQAPYTIAIRVRARTAPRPAVSDGVAKPPYRASITPRSRIRNGSTRGIASKRSRMV